jgi:NAD(P)-dependent dehydrogenase (short-subunit alcohol dehydrogenase family)
MPTCLITGASRGIGLEFARQYAAEGWQVIATCRRPDQAPGLTGIADAAEGAIEVHPLDVTDFAKVEALARCLADRPIDLLINNAGIYGPRISPYHGIDYAAWAEVLRVNTLAPLKVSAVFADHVAVSADKRIVAMTSIMGSITDNTGGGAYIYRSSKAALNAAMRSLAVDLKPRGITVLMLHPGWVRTDMGGAGAQIEVFESVAGMREVIDRVGIARSGRFFAYNGRELSW